jgi:hypothetical protein
MKITDPEEILRQYEQGRLGLRAVIVEILWQIILLTRLWEVILHRHNDLNRDIQVLADHAGLARPSQTTAPWYKRLQRQAPPGETSSAGGSVASSDQKDPDEA